MSYNVGTVTNVTGLTSAAMQTQSSFGYLDFASTWYTPPGLTPTLRAGTTILGTSGGNLTVSTAADSSAVINTTTLQNLLGVSSVLVATSNGSLSVAAPVTWSSASRLNLGSNNALTVNSGANITATGAVGSFGLYSYSNSIGVSGATLSTNGGNLGLVSHGGTAGNNAITLSDTTISVGIGTATITGLATGGTGVGLNGVNVLSSIGTGSVSINGVGNSVDYYNARGILASAASSLTSSGTSSLNGFSTMFTGLGFCTAGCTTVSITNNGNLTLTGFSSTLAGLGSGIESFNTTFNNAGSGNLLINASANSGSAMLMSQGTSAYNNSSTGTLAVNAISNLGNGIIISNYAVVSNSGNVSIVGKSTSSASTAASLFFSDQLNVTTSSGNLTITGGDTASKGTGIRASGTLWLTNNGTGNMSFSGKSSTANGIDITGVEAFFTSGTGMVNLTGAGGGTSKDIAIGVNGTLALGKGTITGSNGKGISLNSNSGAISLTDDVVVTSNGALSLTAANAGGYTGVVLSGDTFDVGTGTGAISGTTSDSNQFGVNFSGNTALISSGAGRITVTGSNSASTGKAVNLVANTTLTTTGTNLVTDAAGSVAATAIYIAGSITEFSGNLSLAPASANNLVIATGATVTSTSSGNLYLATSGNGLLTNNGTISQGAGGSGAIALTTASGALTNAGTISGSSNSGMISLVSGAAADIVLGYGSVISSAAGGNAVVLGAGRNFINNAGSGAIVLSGAGRWLVYSSQPGSDVFGSLDSANTAIWNTSYAAGGANVLPTGNRYVFSYSPTLTVSASTSLSKTYGVDYSSALAGGYVISGLQTGAANAYLGDTASSTFSGTASLTSAGSAATASVSGGPYAITVSAGTLTSSSGYVFNYQSTGTLTVNKAALTITANNDTKTYNGLGYTGGNGVIYSAFVNGETASVLTGTPSYTGSSQNAINSGTYAITPGGLSSDNYTLTYASGTLTVSKAALAVAANASKTYDGLAFNGGTLSYTGLVNGETGAVLGGMPAFGGSAQGATNAGSYAITTSGLTSANYDITFNTGSLTIAKAALAVVANASKTYDGLAFSGGNLSYTGLVNGETGAVLGGSATFSGASQGAIGAGSYAIMTSGLTSANYNITFNTGTLVVSKAALAVVANASKTYDGLAFSGGTLGYTGFVNGETSAALSGTATFNGASQGAIGAGSYALTPGGLTSANYDPTFNTGALVVSKAALAVVANASKTYDGLAFNGGTLSYTGFVNGETSAVLGGTATFNGASQGAIGAGSYALTPGGLTSANYDIAFNTGSLVVSKAALAVVANASKIYDGLAFSGGTLGYTGLVNGETGAVLG
ncbi:MAG: beta strand repeat-containing protein, partial [Janthinobacterium lividum]